MAVTTLRVWAANEVLTAANMKTYLNDNFTALDKYSAANQIVVSTSGTEVAAETFCQHSASCTYSGTMSTGKINFTTEEWDIGDLHSNVTNPTRFTIQVAGKYLCNIHGRIQSNGSSFRIYKNNSAIGTFIAGTNGEYNTGSLIVDCAADDYIEFYATVAGGAAGVDAWGQVAFIGR